MESFTPDGEFLLSLSREVRVEYTARTMVCGEQSRESAFLNHGWIFPT